MFESLGYFIMLGANTRPGLLLWWVFKKKLPKYEQIAESREAAVLRFHYTGHRGKTEESATPHVVERASRWLWQERKTMEQTDSKPSGHKLRSDHLQLGNLEERAKTTMMMCLLVVF